ncbi:MAG TPA: SOS response-associated peptidase [Pseudolysinimonas sp.]|jgi:putative SOS response-associated peptidase YedK|nr:SOS response-associated peptidase [Pseudolysinimonas sp.]
MCGRFAMDEKTNDLIEQFVLDGNDFRDWVPSFSIAPTDVIPIIRERRHSSTGEVSRTVEPAVWDFHPAFVKESKRPQFNARIETVATSGMWKGALSSSRCIVPMRGYYEWTERATTGAKPVKIPYFLHGQTPMLAAAGLATARKVPDAAGGDEWEVSTAIITREARDASGEVHERMPAFLTPDQFDRWLDPEKLTDEARRDELLAMLDSASTKVAASITTYEVDRRVNNSRTVDPQDATLIDPAAAPAAG